MDVEQESRATHLFLIVACVILVALLLELIWGAQWRWLATTVLVGVAGAIAIPVFDMTRRRPRGDVDPDAWNPVAPEPAGVAATQVAATQAEGMRMAVLAQAVCEQVGLDWEDPETRRLAQRATEVAEGRAAPERKPFPIPDQPINPPKWEPGQRRPADQYFSNDEPPAAPEPPRPFSPVADPADGRTVQFRLPPDPT